MEIDCEPVVPALSAILDLIHAVVALVDAIGCEIHRSRVGADVVPGRVANRVSHWRAQRSDVQIAHRYQLLAPVVQVGHGERGVAAELMLYRNVAIERVGRTEIRRRKADADRTWRSIAIRQPVGPDRPGGFV